MTEPRQPSTLRQYFAVPSTKGFSPYRTGEFLHLALSVVEGGAAWAAVTVLLSGPWWAGCLAALATVVALWGVGCILGIASHYAGLMLWPGLAIVAVTVAVTLLGPPAFLAAGVGLGAHFVAKAALKRLSPE